MRELLSAAGPVVELTNQDLASPCRNARPMEKAKNGARSFRNPPQPHMCIQDFMMNSKDPCYINVLSWTKISTPRRGDDPIPLYGGMMINQNSLSAGDRRSPTSSRRSPIFAVMVNPEILRVSGKSAADPMDQAALVDLMLDFVEAMNPEVKFRREFSVLKDRDLAGELKDIWMAIQVKRERERELMRRGEWRDRTGVATEGGEDLVATRESHGASRHVVQRDVFPSSSDSSEDEDRGDVSSRGRQGDGELSRKQPHDALAACGDENVADNSQDLGGSRETTGKDDGVAGRPLERDSILTGSMKEQVMRLAQL
ncbi:uncharacterized protein LOC134531003 isoform X2 [Bacillus rossius redtenbacheri]